MKLRPLLAAIIMVAFLPKGGVAAETARSGQPSFEIYLDDDRYIENQPIRVLLEWRAPSGGGPVAAPALHPIFGNVSFVLEREGVGRLKTSGYHGLPARKRVNEELLEGESSMRGLNLLDWYGNLRKGPGEAGRQIGQQYLPPGAYTLRAELHGPSGVISTPAQRFTILSSSTQPRDAALVAAATANEITGEARKQHAKDLLPDAARGKAFFYVASVSGLDTGSVPTSLVQQLDATSDGRRREPFLVELWLRLASESGVPVGAIDQLRKVAKTDLTRRVLSCYERRARKGGR